MSNIQKLLKNLIDDPDTAEELTTEQLMEVRQHLNPMKNVVSTKKSYANVSIIDMKEKCQQQLLMIGIIGYLYRLAFEYNPQDVDEEDEKFSRKTKNMNRDSAEYKVLFKENEAKKKQIVDISRKIVKRFLDRNFDYNPDLHLRGSHSDNENDPDRIKKTCFVKNDVNAISENESNSLSENTLKVAQDNILNAYQSTTLIMETMKGALNTILDPVLDIDDKRGILLKKYKTMSEYHANLKSIAEPIATNGIKYAITVNPPDDVFHHFRRYFNNHYEQIRDIRVAFYNEKIDIEKAILYYDSFPSEDAAKTYCKQHENEFSNDVFTISNNGVTLLGPFKENRQRVDFYNKNTEVIKRMMDQCEQDHKLGKDLMEKQVKNQKKKNIALEGPDNAGLAKYANAVSTIQELGAKKVLNPEEMKKLEEAKVAKDLANLPDDAIQFDVFYPKEKDGETVLEKKRVYTQAEAPLHMEEGSPYVNKYQSSNRKS